MAYRVPFVDPRTHYKNLKAEIDGAIFSCLERGQLVYRQELKDFEQKLADFVGVKYAVGLNSGYHALHFSLLTAGIGPGDEVITVAHTFVATISAIVNCGATPVLIDVTEDYNADVEQMEKAVTPRTRAVLPVHLNGRLCRMDRVMEIAEKHHLTVVEDAAQSLGATYDGKRAGSFGLAGCFSFYPFKMLGCAGDGGAITTDDEEVATMVGRLRYNGEDRETGEYHHHGQTALLDNIQAAILSAKLKYLPEWIEHRQRIAELYRRGLEGLGDLRLPHFPGDKFFDIYQNYVIRSKHRDALRQYLTDNGVETLVHWFKPVWQHKALKLGQWDLPETVSICNEVVSLPLSAETTEEHVEITVQVIRDFFAKGA
ncbi:MAG: DegT/DnrJ/EryC1/StrS family aminotransferase [Planctomycetota bacterium]|jgi:dTDP-4-amino-4,6-dideoxygalactose transaminase